MGRPNVIVLVFDTARADVFEPYGAPPGSSPAVAQLAERGHAAPSMMAASGWTLPSHAAMFTGLTPRAAGLPRAPGRTPASCRAQMERHRQRILPEVLRTNGYVTRALSSNLWITPESGFRTGFDQFDIVHGDRTMSMAAPGVRHAARWGLRALRGTDDDGAGQAAVLLERAIAESGDVPFFWFVNLVECHSPYLPPRPFTDRGPLTRLRAAHLSRHEYTMGAIWKTCLGGLEIPEKDLALLRHLYERSILQLDAWLARLLEALDRAGKLDETLVVLTSDHGENFGENGLIGHSFSLDQRLIHVPFVAAGPGAPRLDRMASLVELPRLIAEAVGLDEHPWHDGTLRDGIAVAQFDAPADLDERAYAVAAEWGLDDDALRVLVSPQTAVSDGRHKLVDRAGATALYDLDLDPLEERPLPASQASDVLRRSMEDARASDAPRAPITADAEDADLEARMRLLGYM